MAQGKVKWDVSVSEAVEAVAIMQEVDASIKILDVGGGMKPLVFATHVIDLLEYYQRGGYGRIPDEAGTGAERFTEDTYLVRDLCDTPWPYEDNEFDLIWCTQTIEDLRDPLVVIKEMCRVGKSGYITTIHRNFESLLDVNSPDFVGYVHHRWLIQPEDDKLKFVFKSPLLHGRPEFRPEPLGVRELSLWWTGNVEAWEYIPTTLQAIEDELSDYVKSVENLINGES